MLFSHFYIDDERYVIAAEGITEIVPFVSLRKQSSLPAYVAGLLNYHGEAVPVIDLSRLLVSRACKKNLSTRIIIVDGEDCHGKDLRIGFLVERATDMLKINKSSFKPSTMVNPEALTDGDIAVHEDELVTCISIDEVMKKLDKELFADRIEA